MTVKELFDKAEGGALTYEQFEELAQNENVKFADLNEGGYVSKSKHESELEAKAREIETLSGTISTRDADLESLKKQLEEAGADANKLNDLTAQFQALQAKYDDDSKNYQKQLSDQAYQFAVKEFANGKTFSSNAAKRDFIQSMLAKQLQMDGDSIVGADDFVNEYTSNNEDAFVTELDDYVDESNDTPQFVGSTPGAEESAKDPTGGFLSAFHFTPVHPMND